MSPPAYVRSGSETTFPSHSDSRRNSIEDAAGLRKNRLYALIGCLGLLAVIAVILLILNVLLISSLQINSHGMKFLRFHSIFNPKLGEMEKVVHFHGDSIDLGQVETNGYVNGYPGQDLNIHGSRVIITGEKDGIRFVLQDDGCKLQNTKQFQVISSATGRPMFSAQHPMINIDKRIKKISTNKIITNKIRSPVDEHLNITIENLSIRGNEGVRLEATNIRNHAATQIAFNTSRDGSIHLNGRVRIGNTVKSLPLSPSPALSASIDAFRVCVGYCRQGYDRVDQPVVCQAGKPKLYLTPGNKPCLAANDFLRVVHTVRPDCFETTHRNIREFCTKLTPKDYEKKNNRSYLI